MIKPYHCNITDDKSVDAEHYSTANAATVQADSRLLNNEELKAKARRLSILSAKIITNKGFDSALKLVRTYGVKHPSGSNNSIKSKRLKSDKWWLGQLKRANAQSFEHGQIIAGNVCGDSPYISNPSLAAYKQAQLNSIESMRSQYIVNTLNGEVKSLYDVQQHTVSNPAIRRNELMTRINGTEEVANEYGYKAMFYTITTPSRFHARSGSNPNSKYNKSRPTRAQQYLAELWKRIRAAFQREELEPLGFRVAEPHKDATPHWHMLLWVPPEQVERVTGIMRKYALKDNPNERGAKKNRFDVEVIDSEKGSAVGYIAKYISKNIDGYGLDSGEDTAANRVVAWSSLWEVRQFQQIGCPSVSVWRFLRSLEGEHSDGYIESMRQAAITNDYAEYIRLQGGLLVSTKTQNVRVANRNKADEKGEDLLNDYGENLRESYGLKTAKKVYQLSQKKWEKMELPNGLDGKETKAGSSLSAAPWSPLNNCIFYNSFDIEKQLVSSGTIPAKARIKSDRNPLEIKQTENGTWSAERVIPESQLMLMNRQSVT